MDFKQLEVFVSVVKHESFSRAARELFLSQPTVSSHIQNLEKELNTILLTRNNKLIKPTESGKILYNHALTILNNCKVAISDIKEYDSKSDGIIDIACSSIPETYILPSFLKYFYNEFSNVKFSLSNYDSKTIISQIIDEKISFGFIAVNPNNNQIKSIKIKSDELVLITSKDIVLENDNGYIDLNKLYDLNFIMRKDGSGTRDIVLNTLKDSNFDISRFNISIHTESNSSIKEMVKLNLGASFVSYTSIIDYINNNSINYYRIKNINFIRNFYFIYSKNKFIAPIERKFIDKVYSYFNIKNMP